MFVDETVLYWFYDDMIAYINMLGKKGRKEKNDMLFVGWGGGVCTVASKEGGVKKNIYKGVRDEGVFFVNLGLASSHISRGSVSTKARNRMNKGQDLVLFFLFFNQIVAVSLDLEIQIQQIIFLNNLF